MLSTNGHPSVLLPRRYHSVLLQLWKQRLLIFPFWQNKDVTHSILSFASTYSSSQTLFCARIRRILQARWVARGVELYCILQEIPSHLDLENVMVVVLARFIHRLPCCLSYRLLDTKKVRQEASSSYRRSISDCTDLYFRRVLIHQPFDTWLRH